MIMYKYIFVNMLLEIIYKINLKNFNLPIDKPSDNVYIENS